MFVEHKEIGEAQEAPAKVLDEPAKLLLRAAELIEERGHCRSGQLFDEETGGMCAFGALSMAACGNPVLTPHNSFIAMRRFSKVVTGSDDYMYGCDWNNTHTAAEVVAKLREVALS